MLRKINPWIPAITAAANNAAVTHVVYYNQPGNYPMRFVYVQIVIQLLGLALASRNRIVVIAFSILTMGSLLFTFSAEILYAPTFAAVIWRMTTFVRDSAR